MSEEHFGTVPSVESLQESGPAAVEEGGGAAVAVVEGGGAAARGGGRGGKGTAAAEGGGGAAGGGHGAAIVGGGAAAVGGGAADIRGAVAVGGGAAAVGGGTAAVGGGTAAVGRGGAVVAEGGGGAVGEDGGAAATVAGGENNEVKHRRPLSAGEHPLGRGVNQGRVYDINQQERRLTSTAGRKHPTARDYGAGSVNQRGGRKHITNRNRAHYKEKNSQDCEKDNGSINWINTRIDWETTQEACYNQVNASLPAQKLQAKSSLKHQDSKEKFQEIVADAGSRKRTKKTELVPEDKTKGQRRRRRPPYGIRGQNQQDEWALDNPDYSNRKYMYALGDADPSSHRKAMDECLGANKMDVPNAFKQPYYSEHFDNSKHTERNDKPGVTKIRCKGFKGGAKDKMKGNGGGYRSQKEDVLRALSHLNPVQSSQGSVLIEQLRNETYECMVCCEHVRCSAAVWSCQSCYHVFHLGCIRKWAKCPAAAVMEGETGGWRCPGCQNIAQEIPAIYKCFCGKVLEPEWRRHEGLTPHSCGELCRKLRDSPCPHQCNQLCHPGPCPSCPIMITKQCACGKTNNRVRCGQATTVLCKHVCNKILNCFTHRCTQICHPDPCGDCQVKVQQLCYCGKQKRDALCGTGEAGCNITDGKSGYFSCQDKCQRVLDCGNHNCQEICHKGACSECFLKPSLVCRCPCGKTVLSDLLGKDDARISCLDPVPTCKSTCDKILPCSPQLADGNRDDGLIEWHVCKKKCHLGECGVCDGITMVKCRCKANVKDIPCVKRNLETEEFRCDQRCNKKKHCGRHRCNQKCCMDEEHRCEFVCGKKLRCGYHKCLEPCHPGYCPPCLMSGFDELTCHCGAAVLYPPIPCGTQPPECNNPCSRTHACSHPINHSCHSEEVCPPCTILTKKKCMGEHEVRHNIPCHVNDVSCGNVCGKLFKCGHKCTKICHKPPCLGAEESCVQPCELKRKACGHPCAAPCHPREECPALSCQARVTIRCKCGRCSENFPCLQGGEKVAVAQAYQRIATETLANKMKELQCGQPVDISSIMNVDDKKTRQLECNSDCAIYERNRRLAEALNIENADLSPYGTIRFSPFLVAEAKQHLSFVKSVEDALEKLVQAALKMSSSQRSHSFPPMNSNQRRFVHEIAMYYNCSSRSYDREPKRNTVVTATKDSHIPHVKLSCQIEKEINPPPPQPIPFLPSRVVQPPRSSSDRSQRKAQAWAKAPDYFADDFQD